jgi:hypothetical protein
MAYPVHNMLRRVLPDDLARFGASGVDFEMTAEALQGICTNCGGNLLSAVGFCHHCGHALASPALHQQLSSTEAAPRAFPFKAQLGGLVSMTVVAWSCGLICLLIPFLWPLGVLFLLTIQIVLFFSLVGSNTTLEGPCPYCGSNNVIFRASQRFDCCACKRRVVVRDLKFGPVTNRE